MMKKYSVNELWAFVNRVETDTPEETRRRAGLAMQVLDKCDYLDIDTYNDMMDAIAYLVRESYHN